MLYIKFCNTSTILLADLPSHNSGIPPVFHSPEKRVLIAGAIFFGFVPINSLVPTEIVSGRYVFSRNVKHGTPITVVSSVIPPESVITAKDFSTR